MPHKKYADHAHFKSKKTETGITLTFEKIADNQNYQPTLHGLPLDALICFFGKDPRPNGCFILIYQEGDESHIVYGHEKKSNVISSQFFNEAPYSYSECGHKLSKIFELEIGQFIHFPEQPRKSKINGHELKFYQATKSPD